MNGHLLTLFAPNRFIKDFVSDKFAERISELVRELEPDNATDVVLEIGAGRDVAVTSVSVESSSPAPVPAQSGMQPGLSGAAISGFYPHRRDHPGQICGPTDTNVSPY